MIRSAARVLRTARQIPLPQLAHRARFLVLRRLYAAAPRRPIAAARSSSRGAEPAAPLPRLPDDVLFPEGLAAVRARAADFARGRFTYLGRTAELGDPVRFRDPGASPLWLYQLQYLGALPDLVRSGRPQDAARLLGSWTAEFGSRWDPVAWHPYPASLRLSNLCRAAGLAGGFEALGSGALATAAAHAAYVAAHLERDVRGNHLLENAHALLLAARHVRSAAPFEATARAVLRAELEEQVLPDGAHFELSPMYHCVVMHRLVELRALLGDEDPLVRESIAPTLSRMAGFLRGVLCPDGDIPLLGDSVRGFAAPPAALLAACAADPAPPGTRGLTSFPASGLHVFRGDGLYAILDAGPVCPSYLPAHGQADSLSVEVWAGGRPLVADPGVHDYTGPERAWGRSSRAHSTLTIDDRDTSEVYGSFRVGGRARIPFVEARDEEVTAVLEPWGAAARLTRIVGFAGPGRRGLRIVDDGRAPRGATVRSRLHLAPEVHSEPTDGGLALSTPAGPWVLRSPNPLRLEPGRVSPRFGELRETRIVVQELPRAAGRDDVHGEFVLEPAG